VTHKKT